MSGTNEQLVAQLRVVQHGLGVGDFGDRCGHKHPLPGWASIVRDAADLIERHDEVLALRARVLELEARERAWAEAGHQ